MRNFLALIVVGITLLSTGCALPPSKQTPQFSGWNRTSHGVAQTSRIFGKSSATFLNFISSFNINDKEFPCGEVELVQITAPQYRFGTTTPLHRSGSEPASGAELEDWVLNACGRRQVWRAWLNRANGMAGFERV
jgi:hypothetical protein